MTLSVLITMALAMDGENKGKQRRLKRLTNAVQKGTKEELNTGEYETLKTEQCL